MYSDAACNLVLSQIDHNALWGLPIEANITEFYASFTVMTPYFVAGK